MSPRRPPPLPSRASPTRALALSLGGALLASACSVAVEGGDDARANDAPGATPVTTAAFGSWASPIAAADLARAAVGISDVRVFEDRKSTRLNSSHH